MLMKASLLKSVFSNPLILSLIFSVALSVFTGWLWMDRKNKTILFEQQSETITELSRELDEQKMKTQEAYELLDALDEATSSTRGRITEKRNEKESVLKGIDNVAKQNSDENGVDPLDPKLIRMLNEVCERIRGSRCEDP